MGRGKFLLAIATLVMAGSAVAQTVPRIDDLDRANGEGLVSRAEANAWQARADAETKRRAIGDGTPAVQMVVDVESSASTRTSVTLVYPGGGRVEAGEGDTVPGGYKVSRINTARNQVTLTRGKESIVVGFGGRAGNMR